MYYPWLSLLLNTNNKNNNNNNNINNGLNNNNRNNNLWSNTQLLKESEVPLSPTSSTDLGLFLMQSPPSRVQHCPSLRGRLGVWQQDLEFARHVSQYKLPLEGYAGAADKNFLPSSENIFRRPTTYRWIETAFPLCVLDWVGLDSLCASLDVLSISRIFFLGDSLSLQQVQSLWKLLRFLDDYSDDRASYASRRVQCPAPYDIDFVIAYARNDRLLEVKEPPLPDLSVKNYQFGYCWPFVGHYTSSDDRTLLVANTGAHSHTHDISYHDFDAFLQLVDSLPRPEDLVWFRTSVPGHLHCEKENLVPFRNYAEYKPTITEVYLWNKFEDYNRYAARVLRQRQRQRQREQQQQQQHPQEPTRFGPHMELLDVFPMTVLRPDGHAGGADCLNCQRDDCLHYSLPGPIDFWNHLLLSNLVDRASQ